ncbi:MFS transporter [Marinobacterium sp. LSUCC0821]|uniref:AmpG family muropeptide MFS transporter n=1 Tax=Marinobacterium sp. LSUCC0821 TaxID=2668067 RepID=UPI0014512E4A|nr:MFS transporter [Marinobacterium sp. LSUCC0821]QJD70419.1 AmpG family muropeptide MFS transporter [Marinobacterium sp. LSUCC0821]
MISKWIDTFRVYKDKRLLWVFLMGCSSGFPWVLIGSNMSGWLKDEGLSRTAIGFFGSIFAVYAFNFLWAPLVDRVRLPLLGRLGQRRSWIFLCQGIMLIMILAITQADPGGAYQAMGAPTTEAGKIPGMMFISLVALLIAIASATQDIAIDAFRIDQFNVNETEKMPPASAMAVVGWWTGYSLPGYLAFVNADAIGWNGVYAAMALIMALLMIFTLFVGEPEDRRSAIQNDMENSYQKRYGLGRFASWIAVTVVEPFADFIRRNGLSVAITLLAFIFMFKIGEAFLGRMSVVFYKEIGFTNEQIGEYTKMLGWVATVFFTLIGSAINVRFGVLKGLMIGGIAMAASNLMFALIAEMGPIEWLFAATIIVDNFTTAFSTVAFVAFLTALTGRAFSASQYALLASLGNLGRTTLAGFSGSMVDSLAGNWSLFFIITTLMVIPSLVMLWLLRDKLEAAQAKTLEHNQRQDSQ